MSTSKSSTEALDYLGHPCRTTNAFERFSDSVNEARGESQQSISRLIGKDLCELGDMDLHISAALELALQELPPCTDDDATRAVLAMLVEFQRLASNRLYYLFGRVLVSLERGNLLEPELYRILAEKGDKQ